MKQTRKSTRSEANETAKAIRFGFLILNFNTSEECLRSIDSIEALARGDGFDIKILVVDNGSEDRDYANLIQGISERTNIGIIRNEENLGFSAGNNVGYSVLRECVDYLIVSNSDVYFEQEDFLIQLVKGHGQTGFDICGPDIRRLMGGGSWAMHQSPMSAGPINEEYIEARRKKNYRELRSLEKGRIPLRHRMVSRFPNAFRAYRMLVERKLHVDRVTEDALLFGACLIFADSYLLKYERLFEPETFLYLEEEFLYLKAKRDGLKLLYDPCLFVTHAESVSTTRAIDGGYVAKRVFQIEHDMASLKILESFLLQEGR